jgi:hypothetical protein
MIFSKSPNIYNEYTIINPNNTRTTPILIALKFSPILIPTSEEPKAISIKGTTIPPSILHTSSIIDGTSVPIPLKNSAKTRAYNTGVCKAFFRLNEL